MRLNLVVILVILTAVIFFLLGYKLHPAPNPIQPSTNNSITTSPTSPKPPSPPPIPTPSPVYKNSTKTYITFYGWPDNDPAGNSIAYPKKLFTEALHEEASGSGSFKDPITFASDPDEWEVGTVLYVPVIKKYIIMEDWCSTCVKNWQNKQLKHIDIWMGSNEDFKNPLLKCESFWTRKQELIEINPPANRPVSAKPLFDLSSGKCNETL